MRKVTLLSIFAALSVISSLQVPSYHMTADAQLSYTASPDKFHFDITLGETKQFKFDFTYHGDEIIEAHLGITPDDCGNSCPDVIVIDHNPTPLRDNEVIEVTVEIETYSENRIRQYDYPVQVGNETHELGRLFTIYVNIIEEENSFIEGLEQIIPLIVAVIIIAAIAIILFHRHSKKNKKESNDTKKENDEKGNTHE